MSAKLIKENGQVIHRCMYQALTQDEWDRKELKDESSMFMESLHQSLSLQATVDDLVELDAEDVPQYNSYDIESQNVEMCPSLDEEPEVTPE